MELRKAAFLAAITLTLYCCCVSAISSRGEKITGSLKDEAAQRYSEDNSPPQHSRDYGVHSDLFTLTREDFKRLRKAMRHIPIQGTPLNVVNLIAKKLEDDPSYPWEEIASEYLEKDILDLLIEDPDLRDELLSYRPVYQSIDGYVKAANEEDDTPPPEERDQTQGWEGCFADYDAYIGPFTDEFRYRTQLRLRDELDRPNFPVEPPRELPSWSRLLLDANGKRPTGLSQGRKHWVGAVEVCVDVIVHHNVTSINGSGITEERMFKGKYARLDMPLDLTPLINTLNTTSLNITTLFPFQMGVCVPDTCTKPNILRYILEENPQLMLLFAPPSIVSTRNITEVYFGSDAHFSDDTAAQVAVGIAIAGIIVIAFSTCYDGWGRPQIIRKKIKKYVTGSTRGKHDPLTVDELKHSKKFLYGKPSIKDKMELAFGGFSLYTSFSRIFTTRREHRSFHVPALDGLRVLMLMWIIKGMTYVYGIVYFECWTTDNLITALLSYTKEWNFMLILATPLANHGLFFISGFVCVQMWYKAYYQNGNRMGVGLCIRYIILRWLSLMPVVCGMLMFYTCLYQFAEGPLNPIETTDARNCRTTWWTVFVLMHNLVKTDQQCMSWTWMFAAVFQLNLVSLFVVLIPLIISRVAAYIMMVAMYITYLVMTVIWHQKVNDGELSWYYDIVQTPWCNAGPYVIGMWLAILMHDHKPDWKSGCQKFGIFMLWLLAVSGIMCVIYIPWDKFKGDGIVNDWSEGGQLAFDVLAPQILALGLAWITYACHYGYGGIFGSLLNWKAFTALAKVCLPAASFMGPVMTGHIYARMTTFYIHENHMGNLYFGHLINVFYFGVFAAIFFYYPGSKSIKKQATATSRLEIFLHCRHPEILDQFCGFEEEDKEAWEALDDDADEKPVKMDLGGSRSSADIMRGKKPIGGYIPYQEVDGVPTLGDSPVKVPISNGGKVVSANDQPPYQGFVNKGFNRDSDPPAYEVMEKAGDNSLETTNF